MSDDTVINRKTLIVPGIVGNVLEWYDFSLYGYFAPLIAQLFFPTHSKTLSLIATFGIFAVGFLMRPLGAVVFGHFGDRYGRKKTLAFAVILMAVPTVLIGLLPTYAVAGIWAGILLTICRLLQGLAVGGEFSGSIVYIIEHAPANYRGFYGSLAMFSAFAGLLLGSAVGALVSGITAGTEFAAYAWRIPFLFGIVLGFVGLYLRLGMPETPNFNALLTSGRTLKNPLMTALKQHPALMLKATGLVFLPAMGFYLLFVYLSSYFTLYLKLPLHTALIINSVNMAVITLAIPFAGYLSDKVGRKPVLFTGALAMFLFAYPLFLLLGQATIVTTIIAQAIFALIASFCYAAIPATLVEMFATDIRYSAMSLPYNLANTIFGGTAPLMATFLITMTGTILAPSFYLIFAAVVMMVLVLLTKETYRQPLG